MSPWTIPVGADVGVHSLASRRQAGQMFRRRFKDLPPALTRFRQRNRGCDLLALTGDRVGNHAVFRVYDIHDLQWIGETDRSGPWIATLGDPWIDHPVRGLAG